ncbi:MAG: hypothetical protein IJE43_24030 [Alphaproteobacteria bacterium]|nr:hypothetical protein [Alphaproteobacteria bacterium]
MGIKKYIASGNKHPTNIYSKGRLTKSKPAFFVSTHTTNIKNQFSKKVAGCGLRFIKQKRLLSIY